MSGSAVFLFPALVLIGFCSVTSYQLFNVQEAADPLTRSQIDQKSSHNRIVGGHEVDIKDFSWQVSIIGNNSYFCGGFIISENYILTAAHCAQNINGSALKVRAGSSWRKNGTLIEISDVTPHPMYDTPPFDHDAAVLKTAQPIQFNNVIQPIKLPPKGRPMKADSKFTVSGWGKTEYNAKDIPVHLMAVEIPVVHHWYCSLVFPSTITDNMWCGAHYIFGGVGTCQGDSGGAATQDGMATGIVSFGRVCGGPFSPSVFADIAAPAIRDFISEQTGL